jgi:hypothetical protein
MVLLLIERFVGFSTDLSASLAICNALAMLAMTAAGYVNLVMICFPYTKWRIGVVLSMGVLSLAVFFGATFLLGDMLKVSCLAGMGGAIALSLVGAMACAFISQLVAMLIKKWRKMRAARVSVE